jgi:hypothetical protein
LSLLCAAAAADNEIMETQEALGPNYADSEEIDQLRAAIRSMDNHAGLTGVATTMAGLRVELATARQRRAGKGKLHPQWA